MNPAIWVALIMSVAAICGPLLLARQINKQARATRAEDYRRQDVVAARLEGQNKKALKATQVTHKRLEVIHGLVNSQMTAAKLAELEALESKLVMMRQIAARDKSEKVPVDSQALAAIESTVTRIEELKVEIKDRERQAQLTQAWDETAAGDD